MVGKWLEGLSEIQNPTRKELTKLTKHPSVSFVSELIQEYPEKKSLSEPASDREPMIWAADLLAQTPAAERCRCCGKAAWWTKDSGQRVCGVCHPDPRREARHAA